MMKDILVSAYGCNPYGVSESYSSFIWISVLAKKYDMSVITTTDNMILIKDYYASLGRKIPFELIDIEIPEIFKKNNFFNNITKLGYFVFNYKSYKFVKENNLEFKYILHRSPVGIRYFNLLSNLNSKFIIGPLSGGLKIPKQFRTIRSRDGLIKNIIRNLDVLNIRFNPILRNTYKKAYKIIISNDYLEELLPSEYHDKTIKLLETGIDTSKFKICETIRDNVDNKIKLLFIGRLDPYKGVEFLLRALPKIGITFKNKIILDVLGGGNEMNYYKKLTKDLNIEHMVDFHGYVDKEEVKEYLYKCDIFCFPSLKEAVGNVILEAMACGKPIVCADIGGPSELLTSECAIKIPISNEDIFIRNIAESLIKLLNNEELRNKMGKSASERVRSLYDWSVLEKRIISLFK